MWWHRRDAGHPWTAPPARAIRYPLTERLADWHAGRRDGRLGLPAVPAELLDVGPKSLAAAAPEKTEISTNWLEELRHAHHGRMQGELNAFLEFSDGLYARQTEASGQMLAADAAVAKRREEVEKARKAPSEPELGACRPAETKHGRSPELVRRRRLGEHERRLHRAEEHLAAAETDAMKARAALDMLDRMVRGRWSLTVVRARRLHEHAQRRAHVYWRHLVQTHPQGDVLNGMLARVGPDLPEWARGDAPIPALVREQPPRDDTSAPEPQEKEAGGHGDPQVTAP